MKYPHRDVTAVREATDLAALIAADGHQLTTAGRGELKGLCPFHTERTPSFTVNSAKGVYYCFGCEAAGDAFTWMSEIRGTTFVDALEELAHLAGITLHPVERETTTVDLCSILDDAAAWYAHQFLTLKEGAAKDAWDYLRAQGLPPERTAETFRIGYAPPGGGLVNHLTRKHRPEDLVAAGLATKTPAGGIRDWIRGRLLFPIESTTGQTVGFGARRVHPTDRGAKYVNTPTTAVFDKSSTLYGLSRARTAIRHTGQVIVVEGYTDAIAMRFAGHPNVVATCGTAFTPQHVRMLGQIPNLSEIVFGFDGDPSGRKAATRAYPDAARTVSTVSILLLPDGSDPAETRRDHGDHAIATAVAQREPLLKWMLTTTITDHQEGTPEQRKAALDAATKILQLVPDPFLRRDYAEWVAAQFGYPPQLVINHVNADTIPTGKRTTQHPKSPTHSHIQELVALLVTCEATALSVISDAKALEVDERTSQILGAIDRALVESSGRAWPIRVMEELPDPSSVAQYLTWAPPVAPDQHHQYATELIHLIQTNSTKAELARLANLARAGNTTALTALINARVGADKIPQAGP